MATYIEFINESSNNHALGSEFMRVMKDATPEKLAAWFKDNFGEISLDECRRIISHKNEVIKNGIRKIAPRAPY